MLKNKFWIVALFAALTMAFVGCTNLAEGLDDGSGPVPAEDLVLEGSKIVIGSSGNTSSLISGTKVTLMGGTSNGFYIELPAEGVDVYPNVIVYFKVDNVIRGRPGLLMKSNASLNANVGGVGDQDESYQLNDVGIDEGTEFNTGLQKANQFTANRFGFQHQAWNPSGNADAEYTIEVLKVVFPGTGGGGADTGYPSGIYKIPTTGAGPNATGVVFFVNLNDKRDGIGIPNATPSQNVPADPAPYVLTNDPDAVDEDGDSAPRNDIELKFTKENQRAFFKLTGEQSTFLREADTVKITVNATSTAATGSTPFTWRYGIGDPQKGSEWNATSLPTTLNSAEDATFARKTGNTLGYFVIQARGANAATTLRISSIKIEAVKKSFAGNLTITKVAQGTSPNELGSILSVMYTGTEQDAITYTWTRNGVPYGTGLSVLAPANLVAYYNVTMSAYGYNSKSTSKGAGDWFNDYFVDLAIPLEFSTTGDGIATTGGKLQVKPTLSGSTAGLAGNGAPPTLAIESDNSGFTFTYSTTAGTGGTYNYGAAYVAFPITLPINNGTTTPTFTDKVTAIDTAWITTVKLKVTGLAGDTGWKPVRVQILPAGEGGANPFTAGLGDNDRVGQVQTGDTRPDAYDPEDPSSQTEGAANGNLLTMPVTIPSYSTGVYWIAIYMNCGGTGTSYKITDVVLGNGN